MTRKLRLKHGYHDASIVAVRYAGEADLTLEVNLWRRGNASPVAFLTFCNVRNLDEVRAALEAAGHVNRAHGRIDSIIGIVRDADGGFLLDLETARAVHVDCRGIRET